MMRPLRLRTILVFVLGMLTFAVGWFVLSTFIMVERPSPAGIIDDWERICFWPDVDGINAAVTPKGCYSTTCTRPTLQAGTAIVDTQENIIQLETRFILAEASRFPLPCIENCAGGGTVQFKLGHLIPNDYEVWFREEKVGDLMIFSGRPTPRQCFENPPGPGGLSGPSHPGVPTRLADQEKPTSPATAQVSQQATSSPTSATSQDAQQETSAGIVGSRPTPTAKFDPDESGGPAGQRDPLRSNSLGWVEMQDPHFGLRFGVPCFWNVDFPEKYGTGQAYSIQNYSLQYALSFPPDVNDMWDRGGIKIDMVIIKRLHPSISMRAYVTGSRSEADDYRLVAIEELVINNQEALFVTTESSTFGTGHYYLLTLSDEAFLIFSPSPGSHQNSDVQAILHSISFDPQVDIALPDFAPGAPLDGVVNDCKGANQLKAILAGPNSIAWGSGEPVVIYFALVNLTDQELYLLNWLTPFEGSVGNIFQVVRDGQPVSFYGNLAARGNPTPDSYLKIEPQEAITTEVNLSAGYDFSRPGSYTIAFKSPPTSSLVHRQEDFADTLEELGLVIIPSNEISLDILLGE